MPTCIDVTRYRPACPEARGNRPDLVWIGSSSTLRGLEAQRALWTEIGAALPGLRLRLIADRGAVLPNLETIAVPWSEQTEAGELARGDIGIAWMPDDDWTLGKCGLKILQYYAAGLPVIANRAGIHKELVEHGRTGFLADTAPEWIDAIRVLADPSLRTHMGRAGREVAMRRFSVSAWSDTFVSRVLNTRVPVGGR
jgi:glycosyltransferase involved in cell wall biosynthesis